jgi:hypothetical protein
MSIDTLRPFWVKVKIREGLGLIALPQVEINSTTCLFLNQITLE